MNRPCVWYNTAYVVQVNADGTVADPTLDRPKLPKLPPRSDEEQEQRNQSIYDQTLSRGGGTTEVPNFGN